MNIDRNFAPKRGQWEQRLESLLELPVISIRAKQYLKGWRTKSEPVSLKCEDGKKYMVKGQQAGRQIVNDQLVARLGELLDAPVGKPEIIEVPQALIDLQQRYFGNFIAGKAHGSLWIEDCADSYILIADDLPENRLRLVLLATLYGWTYANDHQFLFEEDHPRLIYSVDHGHFFPGGPDWSSADLANAGPARLDAYFDVCDFKEHELNHACQKLGAITEEAIILAVSKIPVEWSFTIEERVTAFLSKKKYREIFASKCV